MEKEKFTDYSHEVQLSKSKLVRWFLIAAANFFLLLGFIGIVTPVLPTTPFILLAAFCYARSSTRFYNGLMNHRIFGPPLRDWVTSRSIKPKSKWIAVGFIIVSLTPTIIFIVPIPAVKVLLALIGSAIIWYILTRPNPPQGS
ncbi:MAG: YbaN family protein [Proteobacteria bacterium]|nr:YbaN family protein [Pseudomonadota bacterium]